jgi:Bacterial protein of unknown function (DUF899)
MSPVSTGPARDALTQEETELTRRIETVAAQRRRLPPGGEVPEDYSFTERSAQLGGDGPAQQVRLSQLFGGHDTLLLYSFMFSPDMSLPCPMCTSCLTAYNRDYHGENEGEQLSRMNVFTRDGGVIRHSYCRAERGSPRPAAVSRLPPGCRGRRPPRSPSMRRRPPRHARPRCGHARSAK